MAAPSVVSVAAGTAATPARRFLLALMASALIALALAWTYVRVMPMAFLESGYAIWVAKQSMLQACDLGELTVFGDSRAEASVIPAGLPVPAANISFGATSPIETYFFVRNALRCPHPPRHVLLVFGGVDFANVSKFMWKNAARYGFLDYADLREVQAVAASLGDGSVAAVDTGDGLRGWVRDVFYTAGFPPVYFSSLLHGEVVRRLDANRRRLASAARARGFVPYETSLHDDRIGDEAHSAHFTALPVQDAFFRRTLDLLTARGIAVDYLSVPITASTAAAMSDGYRADMLAYLAGYQAHYPGFHVLGRPLSPWPDRRFNDRHHLNAEGAMAFTRKLAICVRPGAAAAQPADCDLDWTGPALSGPALTGAAQ